MPRAPAPDGTIAPSVTPAAAGLVTMTTRGQAQLVRVDDIRLIASCENYTEVALIDSRRQLVRRTMQQWTALLPAAQFARVHRGLIVNLDRISRIERSASQ